MNETAGLRAADIQALGWTLLHFLWQGALVAGGLAVLDAVLRLRSANARYLLFTGGLLAMTLLPVATFLSVREAASPAAASPAGVSAVTVGADALRTAPLSLAATAASSWDGPTLRRRLDGALPFLVFGWCVGVALLSARSLGGWMVAQRLRRSGLATVPAHVEQAVERLRERLRLTRVVRLCQSTLVEVPTVIGWLKPMVLLPASTLTGLTPAQLELILAHELAHVRRHDYLVNLMQTVVETLLFYHPAVWWVSRRMRIERENCCDDLAVAAGGDAVSYARALAHLETLRAPMPEVVMAATGGSLIERISRLVTPAPAHVARSSRWLAGLTALGILAVALLVVPALQSNSQESPAPDSAPSVSASGSAHETEGAPPQKARKSRPAESRASSRSAPAARSADSPNSAGIESVRPTVAKILQLMEAGVTPEYADSMAEAGYGSLSWDELIQLRSHGVDAELVRALADAGYAKLSAERLVAVRSQGVSPDFIRGLRQEGLSDIALEDLVTLRSQGVSPEYVAGMRKAGYGDLSVTALVGLRSQGVTPEYASELKALGFGSLSIPRLISLRSQGISPEYVRELKELGYTELSLPVLLGLRSQGVSPEFVRGLKAQGYTGLSTGDLVTLRSQGVTPEFAAEMKAAGLPKLSTNDLIELRSHGVGPDYVRELKDAGLTDLSTAEIVELRSRGVQPDLFKKIRKSGGAR
jgi:beta-lactamase regulating signal transducer with metallopeptidase domain